MRAKDVRKRSTADLREELKRLDKESFEHRFHSHSEEKPDRGFVRRTRRERARILTILGERDRGERDRGERERAVAAGKEAT